MKPRPNLLAAETLPRPPRQQRSLENRERLKAAALQLFATRGYERTSIADVARSSSLAVGTVYQHYRSKRQLLLALMDDLLEQLAQLDLTLDPATDGRSALRELLQRAFSADRRYLGAYRAWQEAVLADPGLQELHAQIHEWTAGRVEGLFRQLQQHPGARRDVDVAGLAHVMDALFWSLATHASQTPQAELVRALDAATHLIFHSLFFDPSEERV